VKPAIHAGRQCLGPPLVVSRMFLGKTKAKSFRLDGGTDQTIELSLMEF
jgi:hypothetical protein